MPKLTKKHKKTDRRVIDNKQAITDAILVLLKEHKNSNHITDREIAEKTGLHLNTVATHRKSLTFDAKKHPMRYLTDEVVTNIFFNTKRQVGSQKLWMQLMEGWIEEERIEHSGNIDSQVHIYLPEKKAVDGTD
jgi:hypothetical protein